MEISLIRSSSQHDLRGFLRRFQLYLKVQTFHIVRRTAELEELACWNALFNLGQFQ